MINQMRTQSVLECRALTKKFDEGPEKLNVFTNINLSVGPSEKIAVIGNSGSGKTTLLQLLSGLDKPTSGEILVCGHNLSSLKDAQQNKLRNQHLSFVYQFHHLLPEFSAIENIAMPMLLRKGIRLKQVREQAFEILEAVDLSNKAKNKPGELSGGERQKIAIARALVTKPDLVFMDEPTGNLDPNTANKVYELMQSISRKLTTSFVIVTHDINLSQQMDKVFLLESAALVQKQ